MDEIKKYFPELPSRQVQQLEQLQPYYNDWNSKINVISRKDITNFYLHHVLHSLAISKVVSFRPNTSVMDVGTGGGFPGIPLAILFPETKFLLVDSIGKKLKVIDAIVSSVGLKNVSTLHSRAEDVTIEFDFIVSRAVTRLDVVWGWVKDKIKTTDNNEIPNGLLYLKGGDINNELPNGVNIKLWELSQWYDEPYFSEKAIVHIFK